MFKKYISEIIQKDEWDEYKPIVMDSLNMSEYKKLLPKLKSVMKKLNNGKPTASIIVDYDSVKIIQDELDDIDEEIIDVLTDLGYGISTESYKLGIVIKKKKELKLRDVLNTLFNKMRGLDKMKDAYKKTGEKNKNLREQIEAIERLADIRDDIAEKINAKETGNKIVISIMPRLIASQSTNVGWTSCMRLDHDDVGELAHGHVGKGIEAGAIVAYLARASDAMTLDSPIARILMKPFRPRGVDNKDVKYVWKADMVYGGWDEDTDAGWRSSNEFKQKVEKVFEKINAKAGIGEFEIAGKFYLDELETYFQNIPASVQRDTNRIVNAYRREDRDFDFDVINTYNDGVQSYILKEEPGLVEHIDNPGIDVLMSIIYEHYPEELETDHFRNIQLSKTEIENSFDTWEGRSLFQLLPKQKNATKEQVEDVLKKLTLVADFSEFAKKYDIEETASLRMKLMNANGENIKHLTLTDMDSAFILMKDHTMMDNFNKAGHWNDTVIKFIIDNEDEIFDGKFSPYFENLPPKKFEYLLKNLKKDSDIFDNMMGRGRKKYTDVIVDNIDTVLEKKQWAETFNDAILTYAFDNNKVEEIYDDKDKVNILLQGLKDDKEEHSEDFFISLAYHILKYPNAFKGVGDIEYLSGDLQKAFIKEDADKYKEIIEKHYTSWGNYMNFSNLEKFYIDTAVGKFSMGGDGKLVFEKPEMQKKYDELQSKVFGNDKKKYAYRVEDNPNGYRRDVVFKLSPPLYKDDEDRDFIEIQAPADPTDDRYSNESVEVKLYDGHYEDDSWGWYGDENKVSNLKEKHEYDLMLTHNELMYLYFGYNVTKDPEKVGLGKDADEKTATFEKENVEDAGDSYVRYYKLSRPILYNDRRSTYVALVKAKEKADFGDAMIGFAQNTDESNSRFIIIKTIDGSKGRDVPWEELQDEFLKLYPDFSFVEGDKKEESDESKEASTEQRLAKRVKLINNTPDGHGNYAVYQIRPGFSGDEIDHEDIPPLRRGYVVVEWRHDTDIENRLMLAHADDDGDYNSDSEIIHKDDMVEIPIAVANFKMNHPATQRRIERLFDIALDIKEVQH